MKEAMEFDAVVYTTVREGDCIKLIQLCDYASFVETFARIGTLAALGVMHSMELEGRLGVPEHSRSGLLNGQWAAHLGGEMLDAGANPRRLASALSQPVTPDLLLFGQLASTTLPRGYGSVSGMSAAYEVLALFGWFIYNSNRWVGGFQHKKPQQCKSTALRVKKSMKVCRGMGVAVCNEDLIHKVLAALVANNGFLILHHIDA